MSEKRTLKDLEKENERLDQQMLIVKFFSYMQQTGVIVQIPDEKKPSGLIDDFMEQQNPAG